MVLFRIQTQPSGSSSLPSQQEHLANISPALAVATNQAWSCQEKGLPGAHPALNSAQPAAGSAAGAGSSADMEQLAKSFARLSPLGRSTEADPLPLCMTEQQPRKQQAKLHRNRKFKCERSFVPRSYLWGHPEAHGQHQVNKSSSRCLQGQLQSSRKEKRFHLTL